MAGAPWIAVGLMLSAIIPSGCAQDSLSPLTTVTREFHQTTASQVDALWVVDNSESMGEEQTGLGQSFAAFIQGLTTTHVDYHIGVISTDPADGGSLHASGNHPRFITPQTPDASAAFLANVRVGVQGSRLEKAFETAALAVGKGLGWRAGQSPQPPAANADFLRPQAALFVIMVSDEDDKSFGPVAYYRRLFESLKGAGNESLVSVSAIVGDPYDPSTSSGGCFDRDRGSAAPGNRYVDLASQTGGIFTSLCSDFNESLSQLALTAAGLKTTFELDSAPNLAAYLECDGLPDQHLCVRVNGVAVAEAAPGDRRNGWVPLFGRGHNAIRFNANSIPPAQAKITVEYQEAAL